MRCLISSDEGKVDGEGAELVGHPATWRLEAKTGGVYEGNDREWSPCVRQVGAASAAVVREFNAYEVLVRYVTAVASCLKPSHRKQILRWDLDLSTLLFLVCSNFVADIGKVHQKLLSPSSYSCSWTWNITLDQLSGDRMVLGKWSNTSNVHSLFYEELASSDR